ncbi:hypothetical protein [Pleurocapsa sp. FMAR1]|uniref:hypothetical protein n=1 Tax=Pleurocapsa sp. FMAR1 TaxID=3040204 RepID=UPI0029C99424|nr:hypothetical protein [Pleurocapsa sp. FMAR1]
MSSKKSSARTFRGMSYRKVQRKNSRDRQQLTKENQTLLKVHKYRNLGWTNVIKLFEKIRELQEQETVKSLSLEELFIEADRIGNKYFDSQEINQRNQRIAQELDEIADIIDSQYPDQKVEIVDYSK